MKKWFANNWFKILITIWMIGGAITIIFCLDAWIGNKQYKKDIEKLERDIAQIEHRNDVIKEENSALKDERERDKAIIAADKIKMKKDEEMIAEIQGEMSVLEERTRKLPLSTVVIETRIALNTREIEAYQEGVLFSLTAARTNLAILQGFSLLEDDRDKLQVNYDRAKGALEKAEKVIAIDEEMFYNFDDITFNLEDIIEKKDEKFDESEKRNVQSYWKGIRLGAPAGILFGLILGFVLGK